MEYVYGDCLIHHGIKGQKWGVRRYQNADGTLTQAGRKRYDRIEQRFNKKIEKSEAYDARILAARSGRRSKIESKYDKKIARLQSDIDSYEPIKNGLKDKNGRQILTSDDVRSAQEALKTNINSVKNQKNEKLKDFDEGTMFVREGAKKYNDILRDYKNAKLSVIVGTWSKKSPEYKKAATAYVCQVLADNYYGYGMSGMTKLQYTSNAAREYYKKHK